VTAPDGRIAHGGDADDNGKVDEAAERQEEDDAMGDIGKPPPAVGQEGPIIPPLDQEQEYEWKWRVSPFHLHHHLYSYFQCMYRDRGKTLMDIAKDGGFETNFLFVNICVLHVFISHYLSRIQSNLACSLSRYSV